MTGPNLPIPQAVTTAAKAVAATLGTASGLAALFVTDIADGSISLTEGIGLGSAVVAAIGTVYGVWKTTNRKKPLQ